jgi:hypothetical protein
VPLVAERDAGRFERFVRDGFRRDRRARELDPHGWAVRFGSYGSSR